MARRYAILMGDLIGSERAASPRSVHKTFNRAIEEANERHAKTISSPLTITLGDEFQGLLSGLAHAWDAACELRLRLLLADVPCRFLVGLTELETPLNRRRAWNMMGSGLSEARDKLNDKRSGNAYRFSLPDEPLLESLLDAIGDSLTAVETEWTSTQLEYYTKVRSTKGTNVDIAKRLGVSPRSLYKVLRAGRAELHRRQSETLRNALTTLDQRWGMR